MDEVGGFGLLSLNSFEIVVSPQPAVPESNCLYMTSCSLQIVVFFESSRYEAVRIGRLSVKEMVNQVD